MIEKMGIYKDPRRKVRPWVVRWFGEYDIETGKRRRYSKSFKLKVEAEAFARQERTSFDRGKRRDKPKIVGLADFLEQWLACQKLN